MGKMKDLTDLQFGNLRVLHRAEDIKPGRPAWLCQCKCGNTVVVSSTNLCKTNGTKSCGCLRHNPSPTRIDLTGQVFGKLKVLADTNERRSGKMVWLCQCECGNQVFVSSDSLRSGRTRSCGCIVRQLKYDLTGEKFGNLLVLGPVKNSWIKGNETRWKCKCHNCGRTVEVSSYWLRHSNPNGHCKCTRFKG